MKYKLVSNTKISLVGVGLDDFLEYYRIRSCYGDVYWNGYNSKPDIEKFRKIFKNRLSSSPFQNEGDRRNFFIQLVQGKLIINIGFVQFIKHDNSIEIGNTIVDEFQGNGFGTIAMKMAIEMAKDYHQDIILKIREDNIASQKMAYKSGFIKTDICEKIKYENRQEPIGLRTYKYIGER